MRSPRLAISVALFGLLIAGCTAPVTDTPDASDEPQAVTALPMELLAPQALPDVLLGPGSGEPNIAVAPDGGIYVTPIDHVYRSTDSGKSFTALGKTGCNAPTFGVAPCPPGSEDTIAVTDGHGDGDTVIDASGRIHWLGLFGDAGAIPYQHSDDKGTTWSPAIDLSSPTFDTKDGTGSDREWLAVGPDGVVVATWRDSSGGGTVVSRTSMDGGATWGPVTRMYRDAVGGPVVAGAAGGQFFEAMSTFGNTTGGASIRLARTDDWGRNWTVTKVLEPPQSVQAGLVGFPTSIFPVVDVDDNGGVYVVFAVDQKMAGVATPKPAARFGVFLMVSTDEGATFGEPRLLSDPDHAALMPFIAAGSAGRVAVTWYENTLGTPNDEAPDLWNVKLWETLDATKPDGKGVTVQLNSAPNHIGSVCTAGVGCVAGGDRSLLDFFEVALDIHGQPVVTWASSAGGTGIGLAAQSTEIHFGGATGTPLGYGRT